MSLQKNNETTLINIFRQTEVRRKTPINFMELRFENDKIECKHYSWEVFDLRKTIQQLQNSKEKDRIYLLQSMQDVYRKLLEDPLTKVTFILILIKEAQNFIGLSNLDEAGFLEVVNSSLTEYYFYSGKK